MRTEPAARWIWLFTSLVLLAAAGAQGVHLGWVSGTNAAEKPAKGANRALLQGIANEWNPNQHARDYHSFGVFTPTNAPPTVYALSFSSSQPLAEVWDFFAARCGLDKKYAETNSFSLSGQNQRGSFLLLDRFTGSRRCETIFGLRTKDHTVTATVRPGNGDRTSAGSIIIVLHGGNGKGG